MNKTIDISIGGMFFHIDEIAYQKLKKYLNTIKESLNDKLEGKNEIISDIELRISELLSSVIKNDKQVVSLANIEEVIKIMGQPEDYLDGDETFKQDFKPNENEEDFKSHKYHDKKLFRDGDDKFIGGVSSGLAHYIGIEPIWIRLILVVSVFGMGFGIPLYILLWILLPEAKTTSEKLQMRGEAININNIEKKIKDELKDIGDKIKNSDTNKIKLGIQRFFKILEDIIVIIFKIAGKFIGALLVIISLIFIGFIIFVVFLGSILTDKLNLLSYTVLYVKFAHIVGFLFIAIPFFFILVLGLRIIFPRIKSLNRTIKLSILGIWLIALMGVIYIAINKFSRNYYNGVSVVNNHIEFSPSDTLNIKMINNNVFNNSVKKTSGNSFITKILRLKLVALNNTEKIYSTNIKLNIKKSYNDSIYVKIRREASGSDYSVAAKRAKNINYHYKLTNKTINLDNYFLTDVKNKFRYQKIRIIIYLPKNQSIYLDNSTHYFLHDVNNIQNIYSHNMANHNYTMLKEGLKCTDCKNINTYH